MEIDEHLKYTLYVFTKRPKRGNLLTSNLACNLIPAQELENRWFHDVSLFPSPTLATPYLY
jgi:hypothetical protein